MGQKNSNYEEPLDSEVSPQRIPFPPSHVTLPPPPLPCGCDRIIKDATLVTNSRVVDVEVAHPAKLSPNQETYEYIDVTGYPPIVKDTLMY